jgi:hypothetical protein
MSIGLRCRGAEGGGPRNPSPERFQRCPRDLGAAAGMTGNHHRGIHGPGRGSGYGLDVQPRLLQEPVQHTPGERAVSAASLKRKVDQL